MLQNVTTYSSFLEFKFGNIRPFLQVLFILQILSNLLNINKLLLLFYFILLILHVFCKIYLIPNDTNFYSFKNSFQTILDYFDNFDYFYTFLKILFYTILYHFIPFFTVFKTIKIYAKKKCNIIYVSACIYACIRYVSAMYPLCIRFKETQCQIMFKAIVSACIILNLIFRKNYFL